MENNCPRQPAVTRADYAAHCANASLTQEKLQEGRMVLDIKCSVMRKKGSARLLAYRPAFLCVNRFVCFAYSACKLRAIAILIIWRCLVSLCCYSDVCNLRNTIHLHLADTCRSCLRHIGRHRSYTRIPLPQPFLCRATWHHNASRKASVMHRAKRGGYASEAFAALPIVTAWE